MKVDNRDKLKLVIASAKLEKQTSSAAKYPYVSECLDAVIGLAKHALDCENRIEQLETELAAQKDKTEMYRKLVCKPN